MTTENNANVEQPKKLTNKEVVALEQAAFVKKLRAKRSMKPILLTCSLVELEEIQNTILELTESMIDEAKKKEAQVAEQKEKAVARIKDLIEVEKMDKHLLRETLEELLK